MHKFVKDCFKDVLLKSKYFDFKFDINFEENFWVSLLALLGAVSFVNTATGHCLDSNAMGKVFP